MRFLMMLIIALVSFTAKCQIVIKDSTQSKYNMGIYPNIYYYDHILDDQSDEFARIFSCELSPYFSYNLYHNLFVGFNGSYEFFISNFYDKQNIKEIGLFSRYILPYTINKSLFRKMHLYCEVGYYRTNYKAVSYIANTIEYKGIEIEEDFVISKKMNYSKLSIPIGITFHVAEHIFIDLNWRKTIYIDGASRNGFMGGVGFNF